MALLEAIGDVFIDMLLVKVFYWPGWAVLRCITVGRYPPEVPETKHNKEFVALIGLLAFLLPGLAFLVT